MSLRLLVVQEMFISQCPSYQAPPKRKRRCSHVVGAAFGNELEGLCELERVRAVIDLHKEFA